MSNRVTNLKADLLDCLLSCASTRSKENLLNEILDEYLFLINDIRKDELVSHLDNNQLDQIEDLIVNNYGEEV